MIRDDELDDDAAIPADDFDEDGWPLDLRPRFGAGLCDFEAALWGDELLYPDGFRRIGVCRRCGCTERRACADGGQGCCWVDDRFTLCSRCDRFPGRQRMRRRRAARWILWAWMWRRRTAPLWQARDRRRWGIQGAWLTICGDPQEMHPETVKALRSLVEKVNAAAARGELPGMEERGL